MWLLDEEGLYEKYEHQQTQLKELCNIFCFINIQISYYFLQTYITCHSWNWFVGVYWHIQDFHEILTGNYKSGLICWLAIYYTASTIDRYRPQKGQKEVDLHLFQSTSTKIVGLLSLSIQSWSQINADDTDH